MKWLAAGAVALVLVAAVSVLFFMGAKPATAEMNCTASGGVWGASSCDCGNSSILNSTIGKCVACSPGELAFTPPHSPNGEGMCYLPSGKQGSPCNSKADCGTGSCALVDANNSVSIGICRDFMFGCNVWIDENGEFDLDMMLCMD